MRQDKLRDSDIHLIFITHNRIEYTKKALESILHDPTEQFRLTIWDNASTDGTREFLDKEIRDSRIESVVLSDTNVGQTEVINRVWSRSSAALLGKLDNDCIVTSGWTRILAEAHQDIEELGVVACWHYFSDDFDYEKARKKIQHFGCHQILRHPFTCGTGFLIKKRVFEQMGVIKGRTTTDYWIQMAKRGYVNGFYFPLVLQEHMDDPKSAHSRSRDPESYARFGRESVTVGVFSLETFDERMRHRERVLENLLTGPIDPRYYSGMRRLVRKVISRIGWQRYGR